jgi:hypothetical protein
MNNINVTINTEEEQRKTSDVPILCGKAELSITNQSEYDTAAEILKEVKSRYKELDTQRKKITRPIDEAKKAIMDLFNHPLELLSNAESKLKRLMINYSTEKQREADEKRRQLQEIADKEAERQKKLLDAKIERAKTSGKEEKAEELEQKKEEILPIDVPKVSARIDTPVGVSFRDKWTAEVVDEMLVPREYLIVNQSALDKIAQATKGTVPIPGVKFKSEKILASRN